MTEDLKKLYEIIRSIPKTLFFNFWYFDFKTACKIPVFINHRVWLKLCSGKIILGKVKTGTIKIGFGDVAIFDKERSRTIWNVSGEVIFLGQAFIGHGSKLSIVGRVQFGDKFSISAETSIVCNKEINFGNNVMISWDVLIFDSDFHFIYDYKKAIINQEACVEIGNDVWIGCRAMIMKGSKIGNGIIVSAGTKVFGRLDQEYSIFGESIKHVVLNNNVIWKR